MNHLTMCPFLGMQQRGKFKILFPQFERPKKGGGRGSDKQYQCLFFESEAELFSYS